MCIGTIYTFSLDLFRYHSLFLIYCIIPRLSSTKKWQKKVYKTKNLENPLFVKNIKTKPPYYPENSEIIHVVSSLGTSTTPFQYNFPRNYLGHYQHLVIYYTTLHYTTLVITMLHYSHTMVRCHLLLYHYYIVLLLLLLLLLMWLSHSDGHTLQQWNGSIIDNRCWQYSGWQYSGPKPNQ